MKNAFNFLQFSFLVRMGWIILFFCFPVWTQAQSYEQQWKEVENYQQKDLPRSAMEVLERICVKAREDENVGQLLRAQLSKMVEQVKLTPDSAEVEMEKLRRWTETEKNQVTAALLYHVMGNIAMQKEEADWKMAMHAYRCALREKELLLKTSAADYAPMVVSTAFSCTYFQDNLYDLLVHQTIAGLMANWQWHKNIEVQEWIVDLYDSLIEAYGEKKLNLPMAALLAHEAKILFLSDEGVVKQLHLSDEQTEKSLRDLLRLYEQKTKGPGKSAVGDQPAMADAFVDVHLKLAEVLCDQQQLTEAMKVLQRAVDMYPKAALKDEARAKMAWIDSPSLAMEIPVVYPSYKGQLVVNYKNLTEFEVETYRLRLKPDAPELNGNLAMDVLCRTYGKKVNTQRFRLPATTNYQARIEKLAYRLPDAGIYVLKAHPVDRKGKADYQLLFVSSYQCVLIPLLDGRTEVVVVDRISGNPVPQAEVVAYKRDGYAAQFISPVVKKVNAQGSVILDNPERGALFVNARTPAQDFMKISSYYTGRNYGEVEKMESRSMTTLFTDRALYRPGQVVHVSGIRYEQLGDSLRTSQGKVTKVELVDVNGKQVSEASATSDLFGVFSMDFTLPKQVLPGYFTLRTANKAVTVRVENYKRPTFDVVFSPVKDTYTFDDIVHVAGEVQTFAGAPVRLAKGSYTVVRSEAWLWRHGGAETALASGTFTTDASGMFHLDVTLEAPISMPDGYQVPYYNYAIKAAVTDGAGETQEALLTLPVGERSMGLKIQGLKSKLACEQKEKIQFQAMNLNKELVKTVVTYQVLALPTQKVVFEGKASSQESFVPLEIYALPAGAYQLKVSTRDDQGRLVTASQDFTLFSLADKRPPVKTIQWFYQDGANWENGKKVSLYVGSSEDNVFLMMDVFANNKRIDSKRILMKNSIRQFDFSYDESYGDGIVVSFAFLREGKFYTKQVRLEKPKPQKQLMLTWESFRDRLTPGQQEVWRMKITDRSGNPVKANLLGALYDASLDKLQVHNWWLQPSFNRWLPYIGVRSFSQAQKTMFYVDFPYIQNVNGYRLLGQDTYSSVLSFPLWNRTYYYYPITRTYASPAFAMKSAGMPSPAMAGVMADENASIADDDFATDVEENAIVEVQFQEEKAAGDEVSPHQPLRQNFAETAFYYPTLHTDARGEVTLSFILPDALTTWRFMGLAHTQQMEVGQLTSKVKSSKPFMVQPNMPRFIRRGDANDLAVSLVNLSMEMVEGNIYLELVDPTTDQIVFKQIRDVKVAEGETGVAHFNYQVEGNYDVLIARVVADTGEFSDGEQHYLPILTDREWVTETIPFQVGGNESITLSLEGLFNQQSKTATGQRLTVEMTANPNWYVIQALSVVANPTQDDAISWATAYYANALAMQLVRTHPRIQQVFDLWMAEGATKETLWSKLEMNADLKQLLLEETPWLAEAQTETEQKRRVALLFELNGMEQRLQLAAQQLTKLQTAEGGWTWYPGMPVNHYTSIQVVELMARLKAMGIKLDATMDAAYHRGLAYLKQEAEKEYERILKLEAETQLDATTARVPATLMPSEQVVRYLYICALDASTKLSVDHEVNTFFIDRILQEVKHGDLNTSSSIYQKALMATILQVNGKQKVAATMMQSIKEYMVSTPEMGSYFDTYKAAYSWNSYRIPTQVAAMEAIQRINPDNDLLAGMRLWLLKQKQTQAWSTPLATADAVYAFLQGPSVEVLEIAGKLRAKIGRKRIETPDDALGYTRVTYMETDVPFLNNEPKLHVQKVGKGMGWGAVYAQFFEWMDKLSQTESEGMALKREYWLRGNPVTAETVLKTGDKLTVRFIIETDRDMDFVTIRDRRAACVELAEQLSGYVWNKGISAYRVNRDATTEFFMDKLPKGKHVLEYNVYVNRTGTYQSGTASLQSVYAPEFSAHTEGVVLKIAK